MKNPIFIYDAKISGPYNPDDRMCVLVCPNNIALYRIYNYRDELENPGRSLVEEAKIILLNEYESMKTN